MLTIWPTTFDRNVKSNLGLKHLVYGNSKTADTTYNSRLQPGSFLIPGVMSKTYDYYADGALRFSSESLEHRYDRSYSYEHGRITQALSGAEARNEGTTNDRPYNETFTYDPLGHLTHRDSKIWTWQSPYSIPETYSNNRSSAANYDAEGNQTGNVDATYTFDSAGNIKTVATSEPPRAKDYDEFKEVTVRIARIYEGAYDSWTNPTGGKLQTKYVSEIPLALSECPTRWTGAAGACFARSFCKSK